MTLIRSRYGVWAAAFVCSSGLAVAVDLAPARESAPTRGAAEPAVVETFSSSVDPRWRIAKGDWKIVDGVGKGPRFRPTSMAPWPAFPWRLPTG
jgi:hypothetical protein